MIERIKKEMERQGITKFQLSKLSGIGRSTIYNIFDNNVDIRASSLIEIAKALNVSVDYLIGDAPLLPIVDTYLKLNKRNKALLQAYADGLLNGQVLK